MPIMSCAADIIAGGAPRILSLPLKLHRLGPLRSRAFGRDGRFPCRVAAHRLSVRAYSATSSDVAAEAAPDVTGPAGHTLNYVDHGDDPYRTRVGSRCSPRLRPHPVVWSRNLASGPLTSREIESYERQGYLQLPQLLSNTELEALSEDLGSVFTKPVSSSDPRYVVEIASQETRSIFEIHKLCPRFMDVLRATSLPQIARQVLGDDVYIHQSRINFKPAFVGKGFYWHSDFETWHAEDGMPVPRALSFSINLTENTIANGPLMLIPGSHRTFVSCVGETPEDHHLQSLREQEIGVPDRESIAMLTQQAGGVEVVTGPPGSAVMFDSNCMHGSSDNITPYGRCNLFLVFNSVENRLREPYYAKKRRPEYVAATRTEPV